MDRLTELQGRFKNLILNNCNVVGCDKCGYKFEGGCSSDLLQDQILEIELDETNQA